MPLITVKKLHRVDSLLLLKVLAVNYNDLRHASYCFSFNDIPKVTRAPVPCQ